MRCPASIATRPHTTPTHTPSLKHDLLNVCPSVPLNTVHESTLANTHNTLHVSCFPMPTNQSCRFPCTAALPFLLYVFSHSFFLLFLLLVNQIFVLIACGFANAADSVELAAISFAVITTMECDLELSSNDKAW